MGKRGLIELPKKILDPSLLVTEVYKLLKYLQGMEKHMVQLNVPIDIQTVLSLQIGLILKTK